LYVDKKSIAAADGKAAKRASRNRELERLGVNSSVLHVSDSRRQCTLKVSDDRKFPSLPNSLESRGAESSPAAEIGGTSSSDTDVNLSLTDEEDDVSDDTEVGEVMSDSDNDVVIVSEVGVQKAAANRDRSTAKKSDGDRELNVVAGSFAASSIISKKSESSVSTLSKSDIIQQQAPSSTQWIRKVNALEATMSEMRSKFAEILLHKVSCGWLVWWNSVLRCNEISLQFVTFCNV